MAKVNINLNIFKQAVLLVGVAIGGTFLINSNISDKINDSLSTTAQKQNKSSVFYENAGFLKNIATITHNDILKDVKNLNIVDLGKSDTIDGMAAFVADLEYSFSDFIVDNIHTSTLQKVNDYFKRQHQIAGMANSISSYDNDTNTLIINIENCKKDKICEKLLENQDKDTVYAFYFNQAVADLFVKKYHILDNIGYNIAKNYNNYPELLDNQEAFQNPNDLKTYLKDFKHKNMNLMQAKAEEAYKDIFAMLLLNMRNNEKDIFSKPALIDKYITEKYKNDKELTDLIVKEITPPTLNLLDIDKIAHKIANYVALKELNSILRDATIEVFNEDSTYKINAPNINPLKAIYEPLRSFKEDDSLPKNNKLKI